MNNCNRASGISENLVENFDECEELIKNLFCCICLEIVKNPSECENCESLYCFECWNMMKITGKNCVYDCKSAIIKAKKFVFDMLSKIRFRCHDCQKRNIPYKVYLTHLEICLLNNKISNIEEANNIILESSNKIEKYAKELETMKNNNINSKANSNAQQHNFEALSKDQTRSKFLTSELSKVQKKELYDAVFAGDLSTFQNLITNKHYKIFEEISAKSYFWTSFHYAMHYGKLNIIFYIMENYSANLNYIMRLESNDGRCPILCLIKSNALNTQTKKELLEKIFMKFKFLISKEIIRELKNRDIDYLIEKYNLVSYN